MKIKKILPILIAIFLVLPMVSAGTISDYTPLDKYGKVELTSHIWIDVFGWFDEKVQEITLTENTDTCGTDCYAIKEIQLFKESALVDSIKFETILKDGSRREEPINSYRFLIKTGEKETSYMQNYCLPSKKEIELNGTIKMDCSFTKEIITYEPIWEEYKEGEKLKEGNYTLKLEGNKIAKREVDWLITSQGKQIDEWAVWTGLPSPVYYNDSTIPDANWAGSHPEVSYKTGFAFTAKNNGSVVSVFKETSVTATTAYIVNGTNKDGANPVSATFVGLKATFSSPVNLIQGNQYWVAVDSGGSNYLSSYGGETQPNTQNVTIITSGWNPTNDQPYAGGGSSVAVLYVSNFSGSSGVDGTVTLNSPNQNSQFNNSAVNFNCSTSGHSVDLSNFSLLIQSGTWAVNETITGLTGTTYSLNTTKNFPDGTYNWSCYACDDDGDCGYPTSNRTFTSQSDYINPTITIHTPIGNQGIKSLPYNVTINYTAFDEHLQNCWFNSSFNTTLTYTPCNITNITSVPTSGTHRIYVYANDSFGNVGTDFEDFAPSGYKCGGIVNSSCSAQYNFTGGLLPSCTVLYGTLSSGYLYNDGGHLVETISCTLEGYNPLSVTYNITDGDKTFTMTDMGLYLNFFYYNGTAQNVTGYWTDDNQSQNFSASSISINVTAMAKGRVKVYFGYNTSLMNYTQFYEFNNDWTTSAVENLTILSRDTKFLTYVKVSDDSGYPLNEVLIRLAYTDPFLGGGWKEFGQRFTGEEGKGMTYFYGDPYTQTQIRATKEEYSPTNQSLNINSEMFTYTTPYPITLTRGLTLVYNQTVFIICSSFNNETTIIPYSVYAPTRGTFEFNTSYSGILYEVPLNLYKRGEGNMIDGVQFSSSSTEDLYVYTYVDENYANPIATYVVKYKPITNKITTPTGMNSDMLRKMAWMGLLIISGILGLLFGKGEGELSSGSIGKTLFLIGCMVLPIIFVGEFLFLIIIVVFYGLGMLIKRWIGE